MQNLDKNCRVCMEWQEHCYWSHMADDQKHFFKPMVGDFTETMSIPARFANNFNGQISEVVSLKSPSGKTWSIGVGNNDTDEVILQSGWKEFVSAHSIAEGDCLLFKYSGVSSFDVLIFDSSGCEKTSPHFAKNHGYERIEGSAGVEGAQRHGCQKSKAGIDSTPQLLPSDDEEDDRRLELAVQKNTGRSIPNPGKHKLYRDIEQVHSQVKSEEEDDDDDEGDAPAKTGYYFCKNGPVSEYHLTEEEKEEISSIRIPAQSTNPVFVQVMHPSHVRAKTSGLVAISSEFAAKYLAVAATRGDIILRRVSSKGKWHVRYNCNRFSRGLTGPSWCRFVRDNGLLDHDVCLFELMKGKQRLTMTVHVLRKVRGRFVLLR